MASTADGLETGFNFKNLSIKFKASSVKRLFKKKKKKICYYKLIYKSRKYTYIMK